MLPDPGGAEALLAARAPVETLVPADVGGLRAAAGVLRSSAAALETAGDSLSRVEVTQWRGDASTSFQDRISVEPGRWRAASDAFVAGAVALERFSEDVVAARATAAEAVEVYSQYMAAVDSLSGQQASTVGTRVVALQSAPDPGAAAAADAMRRQALDLLDRARISVVGAGDVAAAALTGACAEAPQARRFWESSIRPAGMTDTGHTALDALGLLPVFGDPADGANALWYAHDGDLGNASMSAVGLLPIVGEYVIMQKFGRKILLKDGVVQGGRTGASILAGDAMRRLADGGLEAHELGDQFHTIAKHVGKTDDELYARLLAEPDKKFSSTFANLADAERYTYANLTANEAKINAFLQSDKQTERLDLVFDHPVGRTVMRELTEPLESKAVVTRLRKDASMPNGYRIVTSFPDVG